MPQPDVFFEIARLGLPRYAEVDSEPIFRLADRFAPEGPIDQDGLKKALALCRGQMSAVLASKLDPGNHHRAQGQQAALPARPPPAPGGALRLGAHLHRLRRGL